MASSRTTDGHGLAVLDTNASHGFIVPCKRINEGQDMSTFLTSMAYRDIMTFLMQLNHSMFPSLGGKSARGSMKDQIVTFEINDSRRRFSKPTVQLQKLLKALDDMNDEVELDTGPRRFGNVSFRKWGELLQSRSIDLLKKYLRPVLTIPDEQSTPGPLDELNAYLVGSFGSSQRLDYGTGHELSFLAFLGCLWKLGAFGPSPSEDDQRDLVLGVIEPYLVLVRKLILRYTLEPAGSHGVWGLDDHSFLPYIFGSAQYGPAIHSTDSVPTEGSLEGSTDPGHVAKASVVERERRRNMYFGAIGFIYDVKTGPFWEHSPTLYDISGVRAGWGKINKGMLKMYDAEVLGKFPVVQHFPFGSLFSFERDPLAKVPVSTAHTANQPLRSTSTPHLATGNNSSESTQAPWAKASAPTMENTSAPWASKPSVRTVPPRQSASVRPSVTAPQAASSGDASMPPPTKAPWAK